MLDADDDTDQVPTTEKYRTRLYSFKGAVVKNEIPEWCTFDSMETSGAATFVSKESLFCLGPAEPTAEVDDRHQSIREYGVVLIGASEISSSKSRWMLLTEREVTSTGSGRGEWGVPFRINPTWITGYNNSWVKVTEVAKAGTKDRQALGVLGKEALKNWKKVRQSTHT